MKIQKVLKSIKYHSFNHSWEKIPPKTEDSAQYWYQVVKSIDSVYNFSDMDEKKIGILGYACDEGVCRNNGRAGAVKGPEAIRERLAHLAYHLDSEKNIIDIGDINCPDRNLEAAQESLGNVVQVLIEHKISPIILGGGHGIAYGHYFGLHAALLDADIGIINFDAHLDLRTPDPKGNSGTPFHQIYELLKSKKKPFHYMPIGIQKYSNMQSLIDKAEESGTEIIHLDELSIGNNKNVEQRITEFINKNDYIYITIDLDGISSAYAPGVSAPCPLGINPQWLIEKLEFIFQSGKVLSCDIAEMNPEYDIDKRTAKLAAILVNQIAGLY